MHQQTPHPAHDATAMIVFLAVIMTAAVTLTIAECCQHRSRGRVLSDASSRSPILRNHRDNETGLQHRSWHHFWQNIKPRDLEQARSCPTLDQQSNDYGTMNAQPSSDGSRALSQQSRSSFYSTGSSSCSSMLTSLAPVKAASDAHLISTHSFSHTYNHIHTLTYCSEGPVHIAEHRVSGKRYVIKQVPAREDILHEAAILQKIQSHPNIIEVSDTLRGYTANGPTNDIVTPFAELGDLHEVVTRFYQMRDYVPRAFILHFVSSMIDALAYLHNGDISYDARTGKVTDIGHRQPSIVHRDIKPLNIFITAASTTPGLPQLKLADFGLSCTTDQNFGVVGTPSYQAPEIVNISQLCSAGHIDNHRQLRNICTKAGDMYAFGVSLFQLIFACGFDSKLDIDAKICFTYVEHDIEIRDLLKACLSHDPAARPSASNLHALSANIKTELDTWYANGGRLSANMWEDPLSVDRRRAQKNTAASLYSALSIGDYLT
ncbi:putative serine/threonine-protein kinase, active [Septoria linicola]|nr:putative serine/threonine-protein kinase, active [Septoria linicola]